jgi:hypothetical protein
MQYHVKRIDSMFSKVMWGDCDMTRALLIRLYDDHDTAGMVFHPIAQEMCDKANGVKT